MSEVSCIGIHAPPSRAVNDRDFLQRYRATGLEAPSENSDRAGVDGERGKHHFRRKFILGTVVGKSADANFTKGNGCYLQFNITRGK